MTQREAIGGATVWTGTELDTAEWIWPLEARDVDALDAALAVARDVAWDAVDATCFPLGEFSERLAAINHALEHGPGIVLLRGLPVERYRLEDLKRIHLGLASHLGTVVFQSVRGEIISEITDEGNAALERGTLAIAGKEQPFLSSRARVQTAGPLRFHTDRTDVVGLLCAVQAERGGLSKVASATAVHNAMRERRPDLLELLFADLPRSRLGEEADGAERYYMLPVFALEQGHFTTHYSRTYVEAGQKVARVPRLSAMQWEALDLLQSLAEELALTHRFQAGDIQYLNSHVTYHARTAYEDDASTKRNLLRVWISAHESRPLPPGHAVLFGQTDAGAVRGGIRRADGAIQRA